MTRAKLQDIDGVLLLDKPLGLSSNQALQKVKHLLHARKAGHTGSLDPLATGLLPLCFGRATRLSRFLLEADKEYYVVAKLGIQTTTGDAEGEIVTTRSVNVTDSQLDEMTQLRAGKKIRLAQPQHTKWVCFYQGQQWLGVGEVFEHGWVSSAHWAT